MEIQKGAEAGKREKMKRQRGEEKGNKEKVNREKGGTPGGRCFFRSALLFLFAAVMAAGFFPACGSRKIAPGKETANPNGEVSRRETLIRPQGKTLETRVLPPAGYRRIPAEAGSFTAFLREYPLKEHGAKVLLYDGSEKAGQSGHAAVFAMALSGKDLQQCADSVMRVYAEYFYSRKQFDRIRFHFVNGFLCEYPRWRDGERIAVEGNRAEWRKTAEYDGSEACFEKYLDTVFMYAGTLSLEGESAPVSPDEIRPGDIFLKGGSPGHVVMVADVCENPKGSKAFLLAQGFMPAQEFHLLKNPEAPEGAEDPWYYSEDLTWPFRTPGYTFQEGSLRRPVYDVR